MLRFRETVERAEARVLVEEPEVNLLALVLPWWDQSPYLGSREEHPIVRVGCDN